MVRPPIHYRIEHRALNGSVGSDFRADTIYVVSDGDDPKLIIVKCPNEACGEVLTIDTDPAKKPHWSLTPHSDRTISLHPPIKHHCGVKFYISYGTMHFREGTG